jgi:tetratricopeptide (TPR) repeat protein
MGYKSTVRLSKVYWTEEDMQPTELLKQGQLLRRQDRAEAIACFEESIQRAESINDQILISNALTELAIELIEIGQIPALGRAKSLLDRSMDLLQRLEPKLDDQKADPQTQHKKDYIAYAQGLLSLQEGNFREAIAQFDWIYARYADDLEMLANLDRNLAESYLALGEFKTAISYLERSISQINKGNNYEQLGRIYLQLDQYDQAKDYFEQSLDIAIATDDKYLRVQAFIGLSQVAIAESQWENAITVINEVLSELEEPLDLQQIAYLYLYLAVAKMGMGKILEAQEYVEKYAIPRFEKLQNQHGLASAKSTLACVLSDRLVKGLDNMNEETIEAIADEFLEALIVFDRYGTPQDKAKTLYNLAHLYTICNEPRYKYQYQGKAVRSLEQALAALEKFRDDSSPLVTKIELFLNELMGSFL